jgi:reactive intermediate/imine deaminase
MGINPFRVAVVLAATVSIGAAACAPDAGEGAAQAAASTEPSDRAVQTGTAGVQFHASDVTRGLGLPFSESARVGDLLLLSGMIGTRPGTLELVPGGLAAESRQALENIRSILEAAGASIHDVAKCTIMLDDMTQWSAFNRVYVEFFGSHRPARSAFGVDGLALGAAVEIECIAVAPGARDAS